MTKKDAEETIRRIENLETEIIRLESQKISDMTLAQVYGKLTYLSDLYRQHRMLNEKKHVLLRTSE